MPVVGESGDVVGSLTADGILGALRRAADAAADDPGVVDVQDAGDVQDVEDDVPGREPEVSRTSRFAGRPRPGPRGTGPDSLGA